MGAGRKYTFDKVELFFIQNHCTKLTPEQLAEEIGCSVDHILPLIEEFKKTSLPNAYEQMVKIDKRAVAMTGAASQMGDKERSKATVQDLPSKIKDCTVKINENR